MSHGWTVKPSKRNTISKEDYGRIIRTQNHALKASYVVESNTTGSNLNDLAKEHHNEIKNNNTSQNSDKSQSNHMSTHNGISNNSTNICQNNPTP